jgi:hypothetical protein
MLASHEPLLAQLITKADQWRTQGLAIPNGPIEITQLSVTMPDGQPVTLEFDAEADEFNVRTG